jgi:hypothetical protein
MIKLSGSYTGSAYYDANDLFSTGFSELNSLVRSVHVKYYNTDFKTDDLLDGNMPLKLEQLFLYDRTGNLLEERIAAREGVELTRKFYIYNKLQKLSEIDVYGNDRSLIEKWIFRYDAKGNKLQPCAILITATCSRSTHSDTMSLAIRLKRS